jgi:hypothetical protein
MGYDVDENAIRFSNYFHLLRELVHLSCGHLALEPRFEVKALLGDHLHDDARAVTKVCRRLYELGASPSDDPGAPSDELAQLLDKANHPDTHDYLEIAYGELKPTLIAALRIHLEHVDPLLDEPSLRLLTQLLHRQGRHTAELPVGGAHTAFEDLGALPLRVGETRELRVLLPLDQPARDAFIEITDEGHARYEASNVPTEPEEQKRFFHGLMDAALCAAELTARSSHEHPEMPWDFHVDVARQTWDEIRHAEVLDRLMATELGCHWGDYPVAFNRFRSVYARDLPGRLARIDRAGEESSTWRQSERRKILIDRGQQAIAHTLDYLLADELPHVHSGARWGGDEQACRDALDHTATP